MSKKDIILFIGASSSGKDYLVSKCIEQFGWRKAVSFSSRPKRPNEIEGFDYFFRSYNEIQRMIDEGETYEHTEYVTNMGTWLYAFGVDSFSDTEINLCIVNPKGAFELLQTELQDRIAMAYVLADDKTRFNRYNERLGGIENMTLEQKAEGYDRLDRDYRDFKEFSEWLDKNEYISEREIPVCYLSNDVNKGLGNLDYGLRILLNFVNEVSNGEE